VSTADEIRKALGNYATGVTVITARNGEDLCGLTANSFTSVSLRPPLLLFCIGRARTSYEVFRRAETFSVNVLSAAQKHLAERFASSGKEKWVGIDHSVDEFGNAIFPGATASFSCRKRQIIDAADHMIVLGEVFGFHEDRNHSPLVYCRSRYCLTIDVSQHVCPAA
jgi:flavin reductase (DIM6/NTAB) family NADH-FMN oxidoreductase RutF